MNIHRKIKLLKEKFTKWIFFFFCTLYLFQQRRLNQRMLIFYSKIINMLLCTFLLTREENSLGKKNLKQWILKSQLKQKQFKNFLIEKMSAWTFKLKKYFLEKKIPLEEIPVYFDLKRAVFFPILFKDGIFPTKLFFFFFLLRNIYFIQIL